MNSAGVRCGWLTGAMVTIPLRWRAEGGRPTAPSPDARTRHAPPPRARPLTSCARICRRLLRWPCRHGPAPQRTTRASMPAPTAGKLPQRVRVRVERRQRGMATLGRWLARLGARADYQAPSTDGARVGGHADAVGDLAYREPAFPIAGWPGSAVRGEPRGDPSVRVPGRRSGGRRPPGGQPHAERERLPRIG